MILYVYVYAMQESQGKGEEKMIDAFIHDVWCEFLLFVQLNWTMREILFIDQDFILLILKNHLWKIPFSFIEHFRWMLGG